MREGLLYYTGFCNLALYIIIYIYWKERHNGVGNKILLLTYYVLILTSIVTTRPFSLPYKIYILYGRVVTIDFNLTDK